MSKFTKLAGIALIASMFLPLSASAIETNATVEARIKANNASTSVRTKAEFESEKGEREKEREEKAETIKDKIEEKRNAVKVNIEEKRGELQEKIMQRALDFTKKVVERYQAAVERLENIAERTDSRIAKFEASGSKQTKAKELMVTAKAKIELARNSVSDIKLDGEATTTAGIKLEFDSLRKAMEKAKEDLKDAHAALVDVIKNIKPGFNKASTTPKTATSTNATTTDED